MRLCVLCGELQTQPIMTKILITVFLGGGLGSLMRYPLPVGYAQREHPRKFPYRNVLCPLRPIQFVRRDAAFPHHGTLRRIHHLFHLQPRRNDTHPPRQLRNLLALRHSKRGIWRGGGFRRRLDRNNASQKIEYKRRDAKAQSLFLESKDHGENKKPLCPLAFSKK